MATKSKYNWIRSFTTSGILTILIAIFLRPFSWGLAFFSLIGLLFVLTTVVMFIRTKETIHLSFILPLFMTWLYFLAPFLYSELVTHEYRIIPLNYLPHMAVFSALSVIALFLGYYISFKKGKVRPIFPLSKRLSTHSLGKTTLLLTVTALCHRFIDYYFPWVLEPWYQIIQVMDFLPIFALSAALLYFLRRGRSPLVIGSALSLFLFEMLLRIAETLFSKIAYLGAALLLIYTIERQRIPWKTIAVLFLLLFPIFNARMHFRPDAVYRWHYQSFKNKEKIPGLLYRGLSYTIDSYRLWNWGEMGEKLAKQGKLRFEQISYLGQCVLQVEEYGKPLKYGSTFWWLPLTIVPRSIFPWKPVNYHPTLLADEYGCHNPFSHCAMNFPMLVEMYINFGFTGMVVLSFFQGILFQWCLRKAAFGQGDLNLLILVNMLWHLEKVESNITLIFGGLFQVLITWWVISKIVRMR